MIATWVAGIVRRRPVSFLTTALGVAITVALLASLGAFVAVAQATMTQRAISNVAVDWQVQVAAGADPATVGDTVRGAPGVRTALPVQYATVDGLRATVGGTTQQTAAAVVLGLPAGYADAFPGEVRLLAGSADGALVAQQTAANLHVAPGDTVAIGADGATVTVTGIVELPQANSLFQTVGASRGSQPSAPPDNVVLLPQASFASAIAAAPVPVVTQLHVAREHDLSSDPAVAYVQVTQAANNLTATLAGAVTVGDNLAASLDAARSDAAYARILFLFLGLPGAVLAALLTVAVATADASGRRKDEGLLRVRGASLSTVLRLAAAEALTVGVAGTAVGLVVAAVAATTIFGATAVATGWQNAAGLIVLAAVVGIGVALLSVLVPTWSAARRSTVADTRVVAVSTRAPWWERSGLDLVLVAVGVAAVVATTRGGSSLVLAPEGVAAISIDYAAFVGPAFLWIGGLLLGMRLLRALAGRRGLLAAAVRPLTGVLARLTAGKLVRRRGVLVRSAALLALAVAFAGSTAVFDATYVHQAEVDARLTNGADVRVSVPAAAQASAQAAISSVAGVSHVESLQHRYAYVGADLQDLYGVDPATIAAGTSLENSYFSGGTAAEVLARLAATPDGVLVSAETATDYQLSPGDTLTLRVVDAGSTTPLSVVFHYVGIALEFPTAPRDSFLVANASYLASQTHQKAGDLYLVTTDGTDPATVAPAIAAAVGSGTRATPISAARSSIGSSLTSVDLRGLSALELAFGLVLAAAAAVLPLLLDPRDRRRTAAIETLLGVSAARRRREVIAEAALVLAGGAIVGAILAASMSFVLVAVLSGVFDPPPAALTVPWGYLVGMLVATGAASLVTAVAVSAPARRPAVEVIRE